MLKVYEDAIELCRELKPIVRQLERRDRDLARQLRRALTSVPLNLAEGAGSAGGNRRLRYATAMGSTAEVKAILDAAEALDLVSGVPAEVVNRLDKIGRITNRLSRG